MERLSDERLREIEKDAQFVSGSLEIKAMARELLELRSKVLMLQEELRHHVGRTSELLLQAAAVPDFTVVQLEPGERKVLTEALHKSSELVYPPCEGPVMPETPSDEVLEALVAPQLDAAKEHYGPLYGPELRFAISESNKIGAREFYTRVRDALGKGVAKKAGGK